MPHDRMHQVRVQKIKERVKWKLQKVYFSAWWTWGGRGWPMFSVPLAGELSASVRSWGFSPSPWRCGQRCRALCHLQQLRPDTSFPGDCTSHTHKTPKNANRCWWYNNMTVYICSRSRSRWRCGGPRCLASGLWLSAAPTGQTSTLGLTSASPATWPSSLRNWSAPVAHTTPPAWPSKSCMCGLTQHC